MSNRISIIIPVFREAETIHQTLSQPALAPDREALEIIVVDGDPRGETIQAIRGNRVTSVVSRKGRGIQMNTGALHAGGEILLFLHADTRLPADGLSQIRTALTDPEVVAGAFDLKIDSERPIFRLIERTASIRSRLTRIPYGDQAIFIRSDFFREIGGYRDIPIMEDVDFMRRIKPTGKSIAFLEDRVGTSPRRWEKEGVLQGTLRNWILVLLFLAGVSPDRLSRFYR